MTTIIAYILVLLAAAEDLAALCDQGGTNQSARVAAQYTYDAYGAVVTTDHIHAHAYAHLGHKCLFVDRLDIGVSAAGSDTPRLVPFAQHVYQNRNRAYSPALGRWLQRDPVGTAISLLEAEAYHGAPFEALVAELDIAIHYGQGANLYEYLRNNPWTQSDPFGLRTLSRRITLELIVSTLWGLYSREAGRNPPTRAGTGVVIGVAIGEIAGAVYAVWAFGDPMDSRRNKALRRIVKDKFVRAIAVGGGGIAGKKVGEAIGKGFSEWLGTIAGAGVGGVVSGFYLGDNPGRVLREALIGAGQLGLSTLRGAAAWHVAGIALGAAFYAGVVEYAAESAFEWWQY